MSELVYGITFECDFCGDVASTPDRIARKDMKHLSSFPLPQGWMRVQVRDDDGQFHNHICDGCLAKPAREILTPDEWWDRRNRS
jgi:hypothetical protein